MPICRECGRNMWPLFGKDVCSKRVETGNRYCVAKRCGLADIFPEGVVAVHSVYGKDCPDCMPNKPEEEDNV